MSSSDGMLHLYACYLYVGSFTCISVVTCVHSFTVVDFTSSFYVLLSCLRVCLSVTFHISLSVYHNEMYNELMTSELFIGRWLHSQYCISALYVRIMTAICCDILAVYLQYSWQPRSSVVLGTLGARLWHALC